MGSGLPHGESWLGAEVSAPGPRGSAVGVEGVCWSSRVSGATAGGTARLRERRDRPNSSQQFDGGEKGVFVAFADGDFVGADGDPVAEDGVYFVEGDDVGPVDAHELGGIEEAFEVLQGAFDDDFLGGGVDVGVLAEALDVGDFGVADLDHGVVLSDEEVVAGLFGGDGAGLGTEAELLFGFLDGLDEALEGDGLEEEIDDFPFEAGEGVFLVGRDDDDEGRLGKDVDEFEAIEVGHVDVEEEEVGLLGFEDFQCFEAALALRDDLEAGDFPGVAAEELEGEFFVVNEDALHGEWGWLRV